jgi:hypothetical protein
MALFGKELRDQVEEILGESGNWVTVDDCVSRLNASDAWGENFEDDALKEAKKIVVRKVMQDMRSADGTRNVASIKTTNAAGETVQVYKQECLFKVEDYRQVVAYHRNRGEHHYREAARYAEQCRTRLGVEILPVQHIG